MLIVTPPPTRDSDAAAMSGNHVLEDLLLCRVVLVVEKGLPGAVAQQNLPALGQLIEG